MTHPFGRENQVPLRPGQEFRAGGKTYIMQGKLGEGAIGIVRNAINKETGERCVVKILAPEGKYIESSSIDDICARFKREGERGRTLAHDNLVEVFAYEQNEGGTCFVTELSDNNVPIAPFIVMEHAGPRTLEGYIRKDKGIPERSYNFSEEALYIAHEITKAAVYLHRHRHVHRDIKPANIFLTRGRQPTVKLGDFGIVKWSDFRQSLVTGTLTVTGRAGLGTLKYMPPEQSLNPKDVGVRSDIWPLGVTLFELFTNQILRDFHYVYQLKEVRMERSTNTYGRMHRLGLAIPTSPGHENILEEILNCFLSVSSRPSSSKLNGLLRVAYENYRISADDEY